MQTETPQVHAAFRSKLDFRLEPQSVQDIDHNGESIPAFIFDLGNMKGVMPAYETGEPFFKGTKKDYEETSEHARATTRTLMIKTLESDLTLPVRVIRIKDDIAYLSRRVAMKSILRRTLKRHNANELSDLVGKDLTAEIIRITRKGTGAFCDIGGAIAFLDRSEIDYARIDPHEFLTIGSGPTSSFRVKVLSVEGDRISVSRKALLPNPWDELDLEPGHIAKARVLRPAHRNLGFIVEFKPGVTGYARSNPGRKIPARDTYAPVQIEAIDKSNKDIRGLLLARSA